jgi:2-methylcitrate dehydratase PrpD
VRHHATFPGDEPISHPDPSLRSDVSRAFSEFAAGVRFSDLPEGVRHECKRGVLDWFGCALAGSGHRSITTLLAGLTAAGSLERVPVIGRGLRLGLMEAAIANGQMGHVLDFDDTHMDGVVLHTSSPTMAALLSLAATGRRSGAELMAAYAVAFEAGVRVGKSAPAHHDGGWHLTGTLGTIAAGVAAGRFLGLDAAQVNHALGIAATQAAGMQQNRGTMCKSLHAGKAAANGLLAALLAREGFDSSEEIIEGRRGFCRIFSATGAPEALTADLGRRWELLSNGYKPYACGVVLHPLIDGVIALRRRGIDPAAVERIEVTVHPHAIRITGIVDPQTGLQSKFSVSHSAAVALLDGAAGLAQYTDARATAPDVVSMRARVQAMPAEVFRKDEAHVVIAAGDGSRHEVHVEHATGTRDNPIPDAELEAKFTANAAPVVGEERAARLGAAIWSLDRLADANALLDLCV